MKKVVEVLCSLLLCTGISCSSGRVPALEKQAESGMLSGVSSAPVSAARPVGALQAEPPVVVYKTTKDYSRHVPVGLSADKSRIVSYPAVSDVKVGNQYPYPTSLTDGYLLDNRGIGRNVAFLSYTYEEYAALPATPSSDELRKKVIDTDPLLEYHTCGNRYQYEDLEKELNELIRAGKLNADRPSDSNR